MTGSSKTIVCFARPTHKYQMLCAA
jgi:hypothetical protein